MTQLHNRPAGRPSRFVAIAAAALMASTTAGTAFAQQTTSPAQPSAATASDSRDMPMMGRGDGKGMSGQRGERGGKEFKGHGGMRGMGGMGHGGRHAGMMARMFTPAHVADALSTIETGIGVRPDQMEAWRKFTAAVVAFADASQPPRMGMGMGQGRGMMMPNSEDDDTAMADDTDTPAMADEETDDTAASDEAMQSEEETDTSDQAKPQFRGFRMLDRMADRAIAQAGKAEALKSALAEVEAVLTPEQITGAQSIVRSMMRDAHAKRGMQMRGHGGGRGNMGGDHGRGDGQGHHGSRGSDDSRGGRGDQRPGRG